MKSRTHKRKHAERMDAFIREHRLLLKASTLRTYHTALHHFHYFLKTHLGRKNIGKKQILELTKHDLKAYRQCVENQKITPLTAIHRLLIVKRYFEWENEQSPLSLDLLEPLSSRYYPKVPEYLPRPLSQETDKKLKEVLCQSSNPFAPVFLLLRQTGLRVGELIELPSDCVVTLANNEKYLKVGLGKLNTERLVPLSEESMPLIQTIRSRQPLQAWKRRSENKKRFQTDSLWDPQRLIGLNGESRLVYGILQKHFKKIIGNVQDQGKPITFHRLRHTYATSLLAGGMNIVAIMKLLGHKKIKMALQYAKVTPALLRQEYLKAIETLENQWNLKQISFAKLNAQELEPTEVIHQLGAFVSKATSLTPLKRKNLLLRLNRLKVDMQNISFLQKFKVNIPCG